jgi:hypothetical protein
MVHVLRYLFQGNDRQKGFFVLQDTATRLIEQRSKDQTQPGKVPGLSSLALLMVYYLENFFSS